MFQKQSKEKTPIPEVFPPSESLYSVADVISSLNDGRNYDVLSPAPESGLEVNPGKAMTAKERLKAHLAELDRRDFESWGLTEKEYGS